MESRGARRGPKAGAAARAYWLVKSEPETYGWQTFVKEGRTLWDGVRNYQARNHLRAMKVGDHVLFYHSVSEKAVVGIAEVVREAYPDPTAKEGDWSVVDLVPVRALKRPVTLEQIKTTPALQDIPLIKQSRLSVMPLMRSHFDTIVKLGA